jgi:uncharacterized protein YkwD
VSALIRTRTRARLACSPVAFGLALALGSAALAVARPCQAADGAPDPRDAAVLSRCGEGDPALAGVAALLARRKLEGQKAPAAEELTSLVRAAGAAVPWPRTMVLSGNTIDRFAAASRVGVWASALPGGSPRRCGVASATDDSGVEALVIVAAPAPAVLQPIPAQIRPGAWVTIDAAVRGEVSSARLLVMGPRGAPRAVPVSLVDGRVFGRFSADRAGPWLVQIMADRGEGPVPVIEALLHAGNTSAPDASVPGEDERGATPEETLFAMLNAARASEGLPPLRREPALDALGRAQAARMAARGLLAHDVGVGDPEERVAEAGVAAREVGENVAHAASVRAIHRALWASPSHRQNLLSTGYRVAGVGLVRAADGSLWGAQLFVGR